MKPPRGKPPLPIITAVICALTFIALLYTERMSFLSSSAILKLKPCARRHAAKSTKSKTDDRSAQDNLLNYAADDRFEFDPNECSVVHGKWVSNSSIKPLYSDRTCPYLDRQVSCVKNGRPDSDYIYWEWQLDDCVLPRFNPELALQKLQGKRLMFVGDSLQRGQWQSFVCLVESVIPKDQKSMRRGRVHSVFKAKGYNATIEFYWAPFLVESNSDIHIIGDPKQRILRVDSVSKHVKHWIGVDILVFNTYIWWMSGLKIKSLWGSFANGEEGFEELDAPVAYRIGLKTWANWVDSTVDTNRTRVFFTTMSPTHQRPGHFLVTYRIRPSARTNDSIINCKTLVFRSADWNNKGGIKCYNETKPVMKKRHWGIGFDKRMMVVVADIVEKMKFPVTVINITQLSEYRVEAHTSVYTDLEGKILTDEQKADPLHYADCLHWCLPGVPDTWNQIFLAQL